MPFSTIVTLGPSLLHDHRITDIAALGPCIFRINGAHSDAVQARDTIRRVRGLLPEARILIDLPGNKVRTAALEAPIKLMKGASFSLFNHQVNYPAFSSHLAPGDRILANDAVLTFEVLEATKERLLLRSHSDGFLQSNKGLHAAGVSDHLPFLFEKDFSLLRVAREEQVAYVGLSFVRSGDDIRGVKEFLGPCAIHLIAKVETAAAIQNLPSIVREVRSILIDRGDLSSAIGLLNIANAQHRIIAAAKQAHVDVYLATQFLKNMEQYPVPLIAEVMDLCTTVRSGATGIQLSEETAIGNYPVECVRLVFDAYAHAMEYAVV